MTYKMYAAFIASLSLVLTYAADETFAQSAGGHGGSAASTQSVVHHSVGRSMLRNNKTNAATFWPGTGGFFYGAPTGEVRVDNTQPISGDIHYTYTYDVPWDAVHRYPNPIVPSELIVRPYVPGCPAEAVTIPMADGKEQTINIVRCY